MAGKLKINGVVIGATEFAYDGCHKIYLIFNEKDRREMEAFGYTDSGGEIRPIRDLPAAWDDTCFLRFINGADLRTYIAQGEDAVIEYVEEG